MPAALHPIARMDHPRQRGPASHDGFVLGPRRQRHHGSRASTQAAALQGGRRNCCRRIHKESPVRPARPLRHGSNRRTLFPLVAIKPLQSIGVIDAFNDRAASVTHAQQLYRMRAVDKLRAPRVGVRIVKSGDSGRTLESQRGVCIVSPFFVRDFCNFQDSVCRFLWCVGGDNVRARD